MDAFKKSFTKKKLSIMLVFSLISLFTSIIIQYQESTKTVLVSTICRIGGSCQSVQDSIYGRIFGIPLAVYGIISFTILSALIISELIKKQDFQKEIIILAGLLGAMCAIIFILIQAFILHQFCTYCMIADTSCIILAGMILFLKI